jgi:DnaJ-class molecular chaperone
LAADPYAVLGVKKDATQSEIQTAYRQLAKKLHPDLNPGNKKAEDEFKEVSAAYAVLGDPDKRARFDRGEIDASGAEQQARRYYRDYAEGASAYSSGAGFEDFSADEDILAHIFGATGRAGARMRGADVRYRLEIDFLDAVNGAERQLTLPDGSSLDVKIPAGIEDGQILRLRGKGQPGGAEAPAGDALIEIVVHPHRIFTRKGDDIHVELPITLKEAALGGKVRAPTPSGAVTMTVPKWTNNGAVLRLRGKGVPRADGSKGDELITLRVMLPEKPDAELEKFLTSWRPEYSPRDAMES